LSFPKHNSKYIEDISTNFATHIKQVAFEQSIVLEKKKLILGLTFLHRQQTLEKYLINLFLSYAAETRFLFLVTVDLDLHDHKPIGYFLLCQAKLKMQYNIFFLNLNIKTNHMLYTSTHLQIFLFLFFNKRCIIISNCTFVEKLQLFTT